MKSNSVAPALGKPTSISVKPRWTSRSKKRRLVSASIGSTIAWLPSRRSVLSQRGGAVMRREGHCRSGKSIEGNGAYLVAGLRIMGRAFGGGESGRVPWTPARYARGLTPKGA